MDPQVALLAGLDVVLADEERWAAPGLNLHPVAAAGEGTQAEGAALFRVVVQGRARPGVI